MNLYCILFPNKKKYFGIESKDGARWQSHRNTARRGSLLPVHKALRKYGIETCQFIYIYRGITREYAITLEKAFIRSYKTQDHAFGYNVTAGGEGTEGLRFKMPPEARIKIAENNRKHHALGLIWTPESRAKSGAKSKINTKKIWDRMTPEQRKNQVKAAHAAMRGIKYTPEQIENYRKAALNQSPAKRAKIAEKKRLWWVARKASGLPVNMRTLKRKEPLCHVD